MIREGIKKATVIANPGCYSSASILGLAPLVKENLIDTEKIVIDGLSKVYLMGGIYNERYL